MYQVTTLYVWYAWALGFDRRNSYRKRRAGSVDLETNGTSRKTAYETPGEESPVTFGTAYKRAKHRPGPFIVTRTPIFTAIVFPGKYLCKRPVRHRSIPCTVIDLTNLVRFKIFKRSMLQNVVHKNYTCVF